MSLLRLAWTIGRSIVPRSVNKNFPFRQQRWCSAAPSSMLGTKAREAYLFVYTCKVCNSRSERKISKQAYHKGVVLVKCPGCSKNHLVADNLKWFEDKPINIESIMREQGNEVLTGTVTGISASEPVVEETLSSMLHVEGLGESELEAMIKDRLKH